MALLHGVNYLCVRWSSFTFQEQVLTVLKWLQTILKILQENGFSCLLVIEVHVIGCCPCEHYATTFYLQKESIKSVRMQRDLCIMHLDM